MANTTQYVINYDIADDKRRYRVARLLDGYGDRILFSLFEAELDESLFDNLIAELDELINPSEDGIVIYTLCAACEKKRRSLGTTSSITFPGDEEIFFA